MIKARIPYTGALGGTVQKWEKGEAVVTLADRKGVRNHLNSIHAVALTNLGEFASGMALISLFDEKTRGIPVNINIDFKKKARGLLTAYGKAELPDFKGETEHTVSAEIKDEMGDVVAVTNVKWKLERGT